MSAVVVQVQNKEDKWVVGEKLFLLFCRENNILQTNLVWCLTYCPIFVLSLWRTLHKIRFQLPFIFLRMSGNNRRKDACVFFWKCHFSFYCLLRQLVCDIRCHLYLLCLLFWKYHFSLLFFSASDNERVISGVICQRAAACFALNTLSVLSKKHEQ